MIRTEPDYVASPCINLCRLNADGHFCRGCYRSLDEIAAWSSVANDEKRAIVAAASRRREAAEKAAP